MKTTIKDVLAPPRGATEKLMETKIKPPRGAIKTPIAMIFAKGSNSRGVGLANSTLNDIVDALKDPNINILGVYGSSSDGKAVLIEKILRRVKKDELFDEVVQANVSKKPRLKKIQEQLGKELGLQLDDVNLVRRATRLCDRIKMKEKILIILDDLWAGINLGEIGIPSENDHKGCKLVLISETQEVLSNQMKIAINFSL